MTSVTILLIVLVLVLINGLYVASEFAVIGVSRASVAADAEAGNRASRRVQSILVDPRRPSSTLVDPHRPASTLIEPRGAERT